MWTIINKYFPRNRWTWASLLSVYMNFLLIVPDNRNFYYITSTQPYLLWVQGTFCTCTSCFPLQIITLQYSDGCHSDAHKTTVSCQHRGNLRVLDIIQKMTVALVIMLLSFHFIFWYRLTLLETSKEVKLKKVPHNGLCPPLLPDQESWVELSQYCVLEKHHT